MKRAVVTLLSAAALVSSGTAQVKITPGPGKISVEINGKPFTDFYVAGADVTKPYLHPLRAASGTYVTRMWPMEDVTEEQGLKKGDKHQRGLWFAHRGVNGLDFWNNEASYTTPDRGKIVLKKIDQVKSGKKEGSIAATFEWTDLQGKVLLTESRVMTFYSEPTLRVFDLDITLAPAVPVTFGDSKDGALGVHMRPVLQEDTGSGHITNAEGLVGEKQVWGKPSKWCDFSGDVKGEKVGIAIFDNPANRRSPVRWHNRAYGLLAANPFGLSVFTGDKSQHGEITAQPGENLRYRYRVIIHPGDAKSAGLAGLWDQYASGM